MQAIPQLIFNLLAQRQRVILPGLGTLSTEQSAAELDANRLTEPRTEVLFTPVEEEGETLPEVIARQSGLALKEIRPQYNRWLATIRKKEEADEITIEEVGVLIRQRDGSYRTVVSAALNRRLNPLGINTIRLPEQPPVPKKKEAQKASKKTPAEKKTKEKTKKEKTKKEKSPRTSPSRRRAVWLAVAGSVVVVGGLVLYDAYTGGLLQSFWRQNKTETVAPVLEPQTTEQTVPETIETAPVTVETAPVPSATPADSVPEAVIPAPATTAPATENPSGAVYHLIAGVFSNRENAERYVRENVAGSDRAEIIPTTGDRFMVSVGRYTEKSEADRAMAERKTTYPDIWVSKRK
jgi:outer membrane biosynthesis protein TonB